MIDKPTIGETVFVKYNDINAKASETTVEKVGRKYFTVATGQSYWPLEFDIETEIQGYWTSSSRSRNHRICYRSTESLKAKLAADALAAEARQLRESLGKAFDHWNRDKYTLDQLRRIKSIVDEGKEAK